MLKYTRWMASSAPIESSPPLRMWCTVSVCSDFSQHLLSRSGSHQQSRSDLPSQLVVLRHLSTSSPSNTGRCATLMSALMVPGLFTWSFGIAEVSLVPGRACANICHSSVLEAMPETMISEMRVY